MVKIRQVDVSALDKPKKSAAAARELSPAAKARLAQHRQFVRMIKKINDSETVFEVRMDKSDKPLTVRQRLMKAAGDAGHEIVVRKADKGWLVAMATPERRSKRGRRRTASA